MARKKFRKGSKEAKAFMAKLRSMKGKKVRKSKKSRRLAGSPKFTFKTPIAKVRQELNKLRRRGKKISRSAGIKSFYFTGKRRKQLVISEGECGMKRGKRSKRSKKSYRHYGFDGRKRGSRRRGYRRSRRGLFMGAESGVKAVPNLIMQGAVGAAGAVGSAFIANKLPGNLDPKIKAAVPLAIAVLLLMIGKKIPMSKPLAFGAAMSSVLALTKQFVPGLPTLAGVESAPELTNEQALMLGAPQTFGAVQEYAGAVSPADM